MPRCFEADCRKVKADKFPYLVIYQVKEDQLQILDVAHMSRRPTGESVPAIDRNSFFVDPPTAAKQSVILP